MANIKYRLLAGSCPIDTNEPLPPKIEFITFDQTDVTFDQTDVTFDQILE